MPTLSRAFWLVLSSKPLLSWSCRDREAREPAAAYVMRELVPDDPGVPWDLEEQPPPPDAALPCIPFTPCGEDGPAEHTQQVCSRSSVWLTRCFLTVKWLERCFLAMTTQQSSQC